MIEVESPQFERSFKQWTRTYRKKLKDQFPFLELRSARLYGVRDSESLIQRVRTLNLSKPPSWAFGVCWPQQRVIIVRLDGSIDTIKRTLIHELAHLEFEEAFDRSKTPVWFSEGLAQLLERGIGSPNVQLSLYERRWGRAQPIVELTKSFPEHGSVASRAYAQSEAMVEFMRQEFGTDRFRQFVRRLHRELTPFERQFESTFGRDLSEFETEFLNRVHTGRWWHELFKETTLFSLMGLILALAAFRTRRKQRARLADLRLREREEFN